MKSDVDLAIYPDYWSGEYAGEDMYTYYFIYNPNTGEYMGITINYFNTATILYGGGEVLLATKSLIEITDELST